MTNHDNNHPDRMIKIILFFIYLPVVIHYGQKATGAPEKIRTFSIENYFRNSALSPTTPPSTNATNYSW